MLAHSSSSSIASISAPGAPPLPPPHPRNAEVEEATFCRGYLQPLAIVKTTKVVAKRSKNRKSKGVDASSSDDSSVVTPVASDAVFSEASRRYDMIDANDAVQRLPASHSGYRMCEMDVFNSSTSQ